MKTIKIFLASSLMEFSRERMELEAFINSLNKTYVKRGLFFELVVCEDLSNSLQQTRMQETYNAEIRESQYFYVIFGRRAGNYTLEEFEVALQSFRASGTPKVYTYFQVLPEGQAPEQAVQDFMRRLEAELCHFYSKYTHIDTIKLNLLMELCRDPAVGGELTLENGRASVNGAVLMTMENIPLFSKNEAVRKLIREKEELEQEFADLAGMGDSEAVQRMRLRNSARRNEIADQLHAMEMDMLGLCRQIEQNRRLGKRLNWREIKAIELVDAGNYEAAKAVLRDSQWQAEVSRAEEIIAGAEEILSQYISGQRSLIRMLKATGITESSEKEILEIYPKICGLAVSHRVETDVLYEYAEFLYDQKRIPLGIHAAETLLDLYGLEETPPEKKARLRLLLGKLYLYQNEYKKAEKSYRRALELLRGLAEKDPEAYSADLAGTCHGLAGLLIGASRFAEAESMNREGLKIRRALAETDPEKHSRDLAASCVRHANILMELNRFSEAEVLMREAMELLRKRAESGSARDLDALAACCRSLAEVYLRTDRFTEGEALLLEGLGICRRLAAENPAAYTASLATACKALAVYCWKVHRPEESEKHFREAVEICRRLAAENPAAYEDMLARGCQGMAHLLRETGHTEEAHRLLAEALEILRRLAEKNPEVYMNNVASCCNSLGMLLDEEGEAEQAEALYQEAISIWRELEEENPEVYDRQTGRACNNLAALLHRQGRFEDAEPYYMEALSIFRRLCAENPAVYEDLLAACCMNMGDLYWQTGQYQEAEALLREALEIRRREAEKNPEVYEPDLAQVCNTLGVTLWGLERYEESEAMMREALAIFSRLAEKDPDLYLPDWQSVRENLSRILIFLGRGDEIDLL